MTEHLTGKKVYKGLVVGSSNWYTVAQRFPEDVVVGKLSAVSPEHAILRAKQQGVFAPIVWLTPED